MTAAPIPSAALDDRLAIVGTAGSGKTYSAGVSVERILARGDRAIIVDPLGVWWGLRLQEDGKTPSAYHPIIFGGAHGDLPISEHAGSLIGEAVAGITESCILDLSGIGTKAGERRFMLAFLSALYRKTAGEPVHVIFDEADMWAPQRLLDKEGEAAKLQGMMETIVRRGRVKGFIPWLITQRPAVLSKDVLSQADGLVAFKLTSSQDRDAIGDWVQGQADKDQWRRTWGQLATMQRGQGVVWIPGRGVLETAQFPKKRTFDSSRTPKRGEKISASALPPLDLGALRAKLTTVEAETKANDPRALHAEIHALKRQMADAARQQVSPDPMALENAEARGIARGRQVGFDEGKAEMLEALMEGNEMALAISDVARRKAAFVRAPLAEVTQARIAAVTAPAPKPVIVSSGSVSPSARKIIEAICRAYPLTMSFDAAARRAGISKNSSAYRKYRAEVAGCVEVSEETGGRFLARAEHATAGAMSMDATASEWAAKLPPSYGNMLMAIKSAPRGLTKAEIAERAQISPTSSGLGAGLRELLNMELITENGGIYQIAEGL